MCTYHTSRWPVSIPLLPRRAGSICACSRKPSSISCQARVLTDTYHVARYTLLISLRIVKGEAINSLSHRIEVEV